MALQDYPDTPMSRMLRKAAKYVEPAMVLGSAAAATPVAGWAGLLGGDVEKTREALTYQPRSAAGQGSMEDLGGAVGKVVDWADKNPVVGPVVRGYNTVADAAGEISPALGAAVRTAPEALMTFAGPGSAVTRAAFKNVVKATKGLPVGASIAPVTSPKYGIEVEGHHFSKAPRTELDPKAYGTGLKGSDRDAQLVDPVLKHQVSFYVPKKGRIVPEAGVGGIAHKSTLKDVYDVDADPERLVGATRAITATNLQKAGYKGMLNRMEGDQPGQVIMFGPDRIPTTSLGSMSTIEGLTDVPAGMRPAARGRDVQLEKLVALKDLPAGEMSPTSWGMMIKKRDPELHAALEPLGIFQPGGKSQYKDGLLRSIKDATEAPNYRADQAVVAHTNEAVPGASTGHRPDIVAGTEAEKLAYGAAAPWVDATGNDALIAALRREQQPNIPTTGSYTNMAGVAENQPANIGRSMVDLNDVGASQIVPEGTAATTALAERLRGMGDAQEAYAAHIADTRPQAGQNALQLDTGGVQPNAQQLAAIKAALPKGTHDVTASPQGALAFPYDKGAAPQDLSAALRAFPGAKGVPARVDDSSMVYGPAIGKWGDDGVVPTAPFSGEATSGFLQAAAEAPPEAAQALSASQRIRDILRGKTALDEGATGTREDIQNMRRFLSEADWNKAAEMIRAGAKPAAAVAALGYSINSMADENGDATLPMMLGAGMMLPHTPLKPHPLVGTRFERELVPGLAAKTPMSLESMKGGTLLPMPWDSTSRNQRIRSVSDVELPTPFTTTGGQDFARDLAHMGAGVGGASNEQIAKRVQDRVRQAHYENIDAGGTGKVYLMPSTMGAGSENFSSQPVEVLMQLLRKADPSAADVREMDNAIRATKNQFGTPVFKNFAGLRSPEAEYQMFTGDGVYGSAGELRKAVAKQLSLKRGQKLLDYNHEDLVAAINDPALAGVGKGHAGNSIIRGNPEGVLTPSTHPDYTHNLPGMYEGTLGTNTPLEVLMPDVYERILAELANTTGNKRNMAIGAMETRKANVGQMVNDRVLESYARHLRAGN